MNVISEFLERLATGPAADPAATAILDFRDGEVLTRQNMTESIFAIAATGGGKSTLLRSIGRAMLRDRFGGLVLVVKESQIGDFKLLCQIEGRERDLIILTSTGPHCFNPFEMEASPAEAAALLSELAEVMSDRGRAGGENEAFWRTQLTIILRNLFALCTLAYGRLDALLAAELFDGRASSIAELSDPSWQQSSRLHSALRIAQNHPANPDARLAVEYFTKAYPAHGDRLQGSLAATVGGVFDLLRRSPLRELFAGNSTFDMEDLLDNGKICVVGLPALDSADGRIANAILQFCFCRSATRRPRSHYSFLISDECQETASRELVRKLAVLREFKVSTVLLTQNLAVLDDRFGETAREGLLGLMGTKIFGPQSHAATRQWAAEQIGKRKIKTETTTSGRNSSKGGDGSSSSVSTQKQWDYRVPPSRFAELKVGETICLRNGKVWFSKWHKDKPGKRGTVRIS